GLRRGERPVPTRPRARPPRRRGDLDRPTRRPRGERPLRGARRVVPPAGGGGLPRRGGAVRGARDRRDATDRRRHRRHLVPGRSPAAVNAARATPTANWVAATHPPALVV